MMRRVTRQMDFTENSSRRVRLRLVLSIVFGFLVLVLPSASARSIKMVTSWLNPNYEGAKFHKVLVIGIAQDLEVRADFEDEMAAQIARPNMITIPGNQILLRPVPCGSERSGEPVVMTFLGNQFRSAMDSGI